MTNYLKQVNEAIIKDPHGDVARKASHWVAVEIMGWEWSNDICYTHQGDFGFLGNDVRVCRVDHPDVNYLKDICTVVFWQPFTDANHALMVAEKMNQPLHIKNKEDIIKAMCKALELEHKLTGTLTNDTLKGWLEND